MDALDRDYWVHGKSPFPALEGETITQAHRDKCATRGHASHIIDSVDSGICPRCGDSKNSSA